MQKIKIKIMPVNFEGVPIKNKVEYLDRLPPVVISKDKSDGKVYVQKIGDEKIKRIRFRMSKKSFGDSLFCFVCFFNKKLIQGEYAKNIKAKIVIEPLDANKNFIGGYGYTIDKTGISGNNPNGNIIDFEDFSSFEEGPSFFDNKINSMIFQDSNSGNTIAVFSDFGIIVANPKAHYFKTSCLVRKPYYFDGYYFKTEIVEASKFTDVFSRPKSGSDFILSSCVLHPIKMESELCYGKIVFDNTVLYQNSSYLILFKDGDFKAASVTDPYGVFGFYPIFGKDTRFYLWCFYGSGTPFNNDRFTNGLSYWDVDGPGTVQPIPEINGCFIDATNGTTTIHQDTGLDISGTIRGNFIYVCSVNVTELVGKATVYCFGSSFKITRIGVSFGIFFLRTNVDEQIIQASFSLQVPKGSKIKFNHIKYWSTGKKINLSNPSENPLDHLFDDSTFLFLETSYYSSSAFKYFVPSDGSSFVPNNTRNREVCFAWLSTNYGYLHVSRTDNFSFLSANYKWITYGIPAPRCIFPKTLKDAAKTIIYTDSSFSNEKVPAIYLNYKLPVLEYNEEGLDFFTSAEVLCNSGELYWSIRRRTWLSWQPAFRMEDSYQVDDNYPYGAFSAGPLWLDRKVQDDSDLHTPSVAYIKASNFDCENITNISSIRAVSCGYNPEFFAYKLAPDGESYEIVVNYAEHTELDFRTYTLTPTIYKTVWGNVSGETDVSYVSFVDKIIFQSNYDVVLTGGEFFEEFDKYHSGTNFSFTLSKVAARHAKWLSENALLQHEGPDGDLQRFEQTNLTVYGENLALVLSKTNLQEEITSLFEGWKNSPIHYSNMINSDFKQSAFAFETIPESVTKILLKAGGTPEYFSIPKNQRGKWKIYVHNFADEDSEEQN